MSEKGRQAKKMHLMKLLQEQRIALAHAMQFKDTVENIRESIDKADQIGYTLQRRVEEL